MNLTIELPFTFENLYKKHLQYFDQEEWHAYDSCYCRDLDTDFYLGKYDWVKIVADEKSPDEWTNILVFTYQDKFYSAEYREGSHGSGINFYYDTLKEVFPKVKEVIYYE